MSAKDHEHSHGIGEHASNNLGTAFLLNFGFTLLEIAGGLFTNSVAILSDAIHDAGDSLSLGLAWYLQRLSKKEANLMFTYGYERFSTLGAFITAVVLLIGLILVLFRAVPRLFDPEPVQTPGMIVLAVIGIGVNGAAALKTRRGTSLNESVVSWHLLEDVLGWVAVLGGSIAMTIWNIPIIDPLLSIGISLFVLFNVLRKLVRVGRVFLQSAPENFNLGEFKQRVGQLPQVTGTHHTHSWSIDGEQHVLSTHIVMQSGATRANIVAVKQQVREILEPYNFKHLTVEIELEGEDCSVPAHKEGGRAEP